MGVDCLYCKKCEECLVSDLFPPCFVCEDNDECEYCVEDNCKIQGKKNWKKNWMKICDDCVKKDFKEIKYGAENYYYKSYGITLKQIKNHIKERTKLKKEDNDIILSESE